MAKFITNQQDLLKDVFNGHIPKSQGLDFLVGYFYFSGFSEIYKNIGDKKLRILIGMEAEIDINNIIYEFYKTQKEKNDSIDNMRKNYCKNIVDAINKTNSFDIEKAKDAFNFFFEKLADGSLEVKKTKELNHAKMYIFQYSKEYATKEMNGVVVVGSSNLSFNGLGDNNEVNVFLPDDNDYKNAQAIFNELWENAIPLFSQSNLKEFEKAVVEKVWFNKRPSPFLMYARVLQEYFQSSSNTKIKTPQILSRRSAVQYIDLQYQTDAVSDALNMLNRYDGCILSDVVGLGKSIIACAVAANMDREAIIICPPHLMDQWQNTAKDFSLVNVEIFSSGKLEDVLEKLENSKENNQKLIVVDEAHRYRNENTPTYAALHKICISNKVLLLSATPFNNKPEDIFSLLKLFQIPTCSKLEAGENVNTFMQKLMKKYREIRKANRGNFTSNKEGAQTLRKQMKEISDGIKKILQPVIIRRTRIDLEKIEKYKDDLQKQGIEFSKVNEPKDQYYNLGDIADLYQNTIIQLAAKEKAKKVFIGARYQPLIYLKKELIKEYEARFNIDGIEQSQQNYNHLIRHFLMRRFESSLESFKKTLEAVISSLKNTKDIYENKGAIFIGKVEQQSQEPDEYENDNLLFQDDDENKTKKNGWVPAADLSENFIKDLNSDLELLEDIRKKWESVTLDPKLEHILTLVKDSLKNDPQRKIIIFSEYKDTVEYLYKNFKEKKFKVIEYTSASKNKKFRQEIIQNFDAGVDKHQQKNDYEILIATDAISEGFNLHRAGTIYNYDIPYNPTRVIQRIGRINRINKKVFEALNIYNYFPTAMGSKIVHTKEIATFKKILMDAILDSDMQIFNEDEIHYEDKEISWDVDYRNFLADEKNKEILEKAALIPKRSKIARQKTFEVENSKNPLLDLSISNAVQNQTNGVLLFSKKASLYRFCFVDKNNNVKHLSPEYAIEKFKAEPNENAFELSASFQDLYETAKKPQVEPESPASVTLKNLFKNIGYLIQENAKNADTHIKDRISKYLRDLSEVLKLRILPNYCINALAKISLAQEIDQIISQYQEYVDRHYLTEILDKRNSNQKETETVLLAEEFLNECV